MIISRYERRKAISILPSSHSLSVNKPSKAMDAARGDPAGGEIPMRPVIRAISTLEKIIAEI